MPTVVQINTFPHKATGTIMMNLHKALPYYAMESYVVWGRGREPLNSHEISIYDSIGVKWHGLYTRITDRTGFASISATEKLLFHLDQIKPDIIHLHNLHGYYINIERLFRYIREKKIKTVWTLHDCWAFTGHCAYFDAIGCNKWKTGCFQCPQKKLYPSSFLFDHAKGNWEEKKKLFSGLDMTIVTPSNWLKNLVKQSFLSEYYVQTIYNGIDTNVFKPTESNFRKLYNLENKKIILGVANEWTKRKGLSDFMALNCLLKGGGKNAKIVLVGLTQAQKKHLPNDILGIERTSSAEELAKIYSAANVFFNPTYEDNYPTVNLEALACGTPVVTYDTGGSPESALKGNGMVVKQGNYRYIYDYIDDFNDVTLKKSDVDKKSCINEYVRLYKEMVTDENCTCLPMQSGNGWLELSR